MKSIVYNASHLPGPTLLYKGLFIETIPGSAFKIDARYEDAFNPHDYHKGNFSKDVKSNSKKIRIAKKKHDEYIEAREKAIDLREMYRNKRFIPKGSRTFQTNDGFEIYSIIKELYWNENDWSNPIIEIVFKSNSDPIPFFDPFPIVGDMKLYDGNDTDRNRVTVIRIRQREAEAVLIQDFFLHYKLLGEEPVRSPYYGPTRRSGPYDTDELRAYSMEGHHITRDRGSGPYGRPIGSIDQFGNPYGRSRQKSRRYPVAVPVYEHMNSNFNIRSIDGRNGSPLQIRDSVSNRLTQKKKRKISRRRHGKKYYM